MKTPQSTRARAIGLLALLITLLIRGPSIAQPQAGMLTTPSAYGFTETLARLRSALQAKGFTVFATIDHAAGATGVGQTLRPTTVVIFGNPAAGTPLMQAQQTIGLDLPLKILVWEDQNNKTWITSDDPAWLAQRHAIPTTTPQIAGMSAALKALAEAAGQN